MAQRINPYAFRLGYNQSWKSYFFPKNKKEWADYLQKDRSIRNCLCPFSPIDVKTRYVLNNIFVFAYISEAEADMMLKKNIEKVDKMMKEIHSLINNNKISVLIEFHKVKEVYDHAQLVSNFIAEEVKNKVNSFKVLKRTLNRVIKNKKIKGVEIKISGRLDNSDNTRTRKESWGRLMLNSKDSIIDEGETEVVTDSGKINIKVLFYKGRGVHKKVLFEKNFEEETRIKKQSSRYDDT